MLDLVSWPSFHGKPAVFLPYMQSSRASESGVDLRTESTKVMAVTLAHLFAEACQCLLHPCNSRGLSVV
jgi:hypothetical protein